MTFIKEIYEPQSVKSGLNDEVVHYANVMTLSPLLTETWSFETMRCLNINTHCQKRHDVGNDVKVNFLICRIVGCMKSMLFLVNILFSILNMCAKEIAEKLTLIHFLPQVCMI